MAYSMDRIPPNTATTMTWQEWAVIVIAIIVGVVLTHRIWRFFVCGDTGSSCDSCNKECHHRRK
jgi:hypothetical protein